MSGYSNSNFIKPEIARWEFEIIEISNGIYEWKDTNDQGIEISMKGYLESQIQHALKELENRVKSIQ
jgi:hypothetical protein